MQTFERRISSSDQINTIVCYFALPEHNTQTKIKGIVQISHGMCEYIQRYSKFINVLVNAGYIVCGHDHIGHGKSCPSTEVFGYFGEEGGFRFLVEDLYKVNQMLHQEYPGLPLFIFAHSMGSLVARLYMSKFPLSFSGIILCGTAGHNPATRLGLAVCNLIIYGRGSLYRPKFMDQLIFGSYNRHYPYPRTPKDWLSRDTSVVEKFLADDHCSFLFAASGYRDLLSLQYYSNTSTWYRTLSPAISCYLIAGSMDPVGDYGKGVKTVYHRMKRAGVADVSLCLYPEARHELLNEINHQQVEVDILKWIEHRLPAEAENFIAHI